MDEETYQEYKKQFSWVDEWYIRYVPPSRANSIRYTDYISWRDPRWDILFFSIRKHDINPWIEIRKSESLWFNFLYNSTLVYSVMTEASCCGFIEAIRFFIDNGMTVKGFWSCLDGALSYNHVDCAKLLLSKGAILSDDAIKYCIEYSSKEALQFVIEQGRQPNINSDWKELLDKPLLHDPSFRSFFYKQDWSTCPEIANNIEQKKLELDAILKWVNVPIDVIKYVIYCYI